MIPTQQATESIPLTPFQVFVDGLTGDGLRLPAFGNLSLTRDVAAQATAQHLSARTGLSGRPFGDEKVDELPEEAGTRTIRGGIGVRVGEHEIESLSILREIRQPPAGGSQSRPIGFVEVAVGEKIELADREHHPRLNPAELELNPRKYGGGEGLRGVGDVDAPLVSTGDGDGVWNGLEAGLRLKYRVYLPNAFGKSPTVVRREFRGGDDIADDDSV